MVEMKQGKLYCFIYLFIFLNDLFDDILNLKKKKFII